MQRVRRRAGLQIVGPAVRPKTPPRPPAEIKFDGVNDLSYVDVVFDVMQRGTTVNFRTLLDEYSRFNLDIVASRRMGSRDVVAALKAAVARHWAPRHQRCDIRIVNLCYSDTVAPGVFSLAAQTHQSLHERGRASPTHYCQNARNHRANRLVWKMCQ